MLHPSTMAKHINTLDVVFADIEEAEHQRKPVESRLVVYHELSKTASSA